MESKVIIPVETIPNVLSTIDTKCIENLIHRSP